MTKLLYFDWSQGEHQTRARQPHHGLAYGRRRARGLAAGSAGMSTRVAIAPGGCGGVGVSPPERAVSAGTLGTLGTRRASAACRVINVPGWYDFSYARMASAMCRGVSPCAIWWTPRFKPWIWLEWETVGMCSDQWWPKLHTAMVGGQQRGCYSRWHSFGNYRGRPPTIRGYMTG